VWDGAQLGMRHGSDQLPVQPTAVSLLTPTHLVLLHVGALAPLRRRGAASRAGAGGDVRVIRLRRPGGSARRSIATGERFESE
jgi:hypothetical protein